MTGQQDRFQQAMNQGHSAAWDQMWDRAASFYQQALDEIPDHPQALTSLGLALFEMQDYEAALRVYQRAAKALPNDPLPLEKAAQLLERLGNLEQASQVSLYAAEMYLKNRDANKAIENWQRVTRIKPENLQAHSRLAMVYERMGDKTRAVSEYIAVASLMQSSGDVEKAMLSINRALQVLPESEDARQALVMIKSFKPLPKPNRPRGGTAPLRMAQVRQLDVPKTSHLDKKADPVSQTRQKALTTLAGMLFEAADDAQDEQGSRPTGLQSIMRGVIGEGRQPDRSRIALHLSQVVDLQTKGQYEQAAAELEHAMEAGLDIPAAHFDLGCLQVETNKPESAIRHLQASASHPDFALGAHLLLGQTLQKINRLKEASVEYLEALKLGDAQVVSPEDADDLRQLYEPLIEAQRHSTDAEAQANLCNNVQALLDQPGWQAQLSRARQQLPSSFGGLTLPLAEIITEARSSHVIEALSAIYDLAYKGCTRSAMEEAFYALEQAPTYLPLHSYMGELLLQQDRIQAAIAKFLVVARAYSIRGEANRAISLYRRIIELAPMDLEARTCLIDQHVASGQLEEAINGYLSLGDVYYSLADLDMVRKTYTAALRLAQQAKVDRSWRVKIMHRMADIDLQSLDWRQALRLFEQIRTLQPDDEKARTSLIDLNYRLSQEGQALAELDNFIAYLDGAGQRSRIVQLLEGLVAENPERIGIRRRLAEAYRQVGRVKEAIEQFDRVGEALVNAGDKAGAAQAVEAILALNPGNKAEYQQLLATLR